MNALPRFIASFFIWVTSNIIVWKPQVLLLFQNPDWFKFIDVTRDISIISGSLAGIVALCSAIQLMKKRKLEIKHLELENKKLEKECEGE